MTLGHRLLTASEGGEGFVPPTYQEFYQPLFGTSGAFAVTRPMILAVLSGVLLIGMLLIATRNLKVVPAKGQFILEGVYDMVRNSIARDMIGEKQFRPYIPVLFSLFIMILLNNLFSVVPMIQFPTMSRIGFPIALTIIVYLLYLVIGFKKHGPIGYFKRMVPQGVPKLVGPVLIILETITYFFTRPVTLALRLFANMFAGHMLLLVFILGGEYMLLHGSNTFIQVSSVAGFFLGIAMSFFEMLVQFLQAYVFTLLAAFYIQDALADEH